MILLMLVCESKEVIDPACEHPLGRPHENRQELLGISIVHVH